MTRRIATYNWRMMSNTTSGTAEDMTTSCPQAQRRGGLELLGDLGDHQAGVRFKSPHCSTPAAISWWDDDDNDGAVRTCCSLWINRLSR